MWRMFTSGISVIFSVFYLVGITVLLLHLALASRWNAKAGRPSPYPPQMLSKRIVALVPVYNEDVSLLKRTLTCLLAQTRKIDAICVVDDGSTEVDYSDVRIWFESLAARTGVDAHWLRQENAGKRHAQVVGLALEPEADFFLTIDSDTMLTSRVVELISKPLADPSIQSVGGMVLVLNWTKNLLTRMQEIWFASIQMIQRAGLAQAGSVIVNSGAVVLYRAEVLRDNVKLYLEERVLRRQVSFSDDALLTLLALERGKVIMEPTAFSFTVLPESLSHHRRQQLRWFRGSMLRSFWRLRRLPASRFAYWYSLVAFSRRILSIVLVIAIAATLAVRHPGALGHLGLWMVCFAAAVQTAISTPYLFTRRWDQTRIQQMLVLACASLVGIWTTTVLFVLNVYGTLTFWITGKWGSRQTVEVTDQQDWEANAGLLVPSRVGLDAGVGLNPTHGDPSSLGGLAGQALANLTSPNDSPRAPGTSAFQTAQFHVSIPFEKDHNMMSSSFNVPITGETLATLPGRLLWPGRVAVVGLGYVGLPLALQAAEAGFEVVGFDVSESVVENLRNGVSHVDDVDNDEVRDLDLLGFQCDSDPAILCDADVYVVCVPTPLTEDGDVDLRAVAAAGAAVGGCLRPGSLVILESTPRPGTTEEFFGPIIERHSGLVAGQDFCLAFSSERIDPGNPTWGLRNTPKVVGGVNQESLERAVQFYGAFVEKVVPVSSPRAAEVSKLLENTYRLVNLALVNELAQVAEPLGIDIWEVIGAAATKPFGFHAFWPGPGVGGHCIPVDPAYLNDYVAERAGAPLRMVELALQINRQMPQFVALRAGVMIEQSGKDIATSSVLLLGVTYKANIGDTRETPAFPLGLELAAFGVEVSYHDPLVTSWCDGQFRRVSDEELSAEVERADLVILLQDHAAYDVDSLAQAANLFLDTRGVTSPLSGAERL